MLSHNLLDICSSLTEKEITTKKNIFEIVEFNDQNLYISSEIHFFSKSNLGLDIVDSKSNFTCFYMGFAFDKNLNQFDALPEMSLV